MFIPSGVGCVYVFPQPGNQATPQLVKCWAVVIATSQAAPQLVKGWAVVIATSQAAPQLVKC